MITDDEGKLITTTAVKSYRRSPDLSRLLSEALADLSESVNTQTKQTSQPTDQPFGTVPDEALIEALDKYAWDQWH